VHQSPRLNPWILAQYLPHVPRENADLRKLFDREQTGAQAIVDVVVVVGDLVGEIGELRFERRLPPLYETLANIAQSASIRQRTML
jgi:hypothetical protein